MYDLTFTDGHGFTAVASMRDPHRTLERLDGWYGGAGTDTEQIDRLTDGTVPAPLRRGPRKIVLGLAELFATRAEAVNRQREASGVFRSGEPGAGLLTVRNETGELSAHNVALDDTPRVSTSLDDDGHHVKWELALVAPDPRLYAAPQRSMIATPGIGVGLRYPLYQPGYLDYGAEAELDATLLLNEGNAPAYPDVLVQGDMPNGFKLRLGGDVPAGVGVEYAGPVTALQSVAVDFLNGSATVGGIDQSWALTAATWGGVPPGGSVAAMVYPLSGGTGYAALELRSTYM